ncbi:MAG: UDP-N-acetylmuramoyl-L-alanine--D-glutamate ligase [Nitrospirae bacterium]|nr:MAG: UDP-N-acetylmuramoyl-L-alanine--D-glutamate ligase [Nitrospirota bacterium]
MDLKGKSVIVVGLARSGVGAANLLAGMGALVTVTDMKPAADLQDQLGRLSPEVRTVLGGHPDELFLAADLLVVSPGVPTIPPIAAAKARGVPVIGELELAYEILHEARDRDIPFMAVTGSNGKSTTTTLLDLMLRKNGARTLLGGNIGNALTEEILACGEPGSMPGAAVREKFDCVVAEVSSFQLETIAAFRPRIAAVLNVTPDHMDRYPSLDAYAEAKARIFENQAQGDLLVLNADDPGVMKLYEAGLKKAGESGPRVYFFSRRQKVNGVFSQDGKVWCSMPVCSDREPIVLIGTDEIGIQGVHNLENAMAASAMALLAGCSPEAVRSSLREFRGLEHRLEAVRELEGVRYVNDSKGTNVDAVLKSIESFHGPIVLIAGGRDKAGDFKALRDLVSRKVRAVVLIGEAAGKIAEAIGGLTEILSAQNMHEAVALSRSKARPGDVVLLSPACASFDMFRDFEDRGRQFKRSVMELNG